MFDAIRYEDGASQETVTGWVCKKCHRFYGSDERTARWCCATDLPCNTDGCEGRAEKHYSLCTKCREKKNSDKFFALDQEDWDGETMLYSETLGEYFSDIDSIIEHLFLHAAKAEDLRLVVCEPQTAPEFSVLDHLVDVLPDRYDGAEYEGSDAEQALNEYLKNLGPISWTPGSARLSQKCLDEFDLEVQKAKSEDPDGYGIEEVSHVK